MNIVYAMETGALPDPAGGTVLVRKGTHWSADDAIVRSHPEWFSPDGRYGLSWTGEPPKEMSEPPVETATARPGEKRTVRRG